MFLPEGYTIPPQSTYTYSEPIVIRSSGGWTLSVMVGYVREHPEHNQIVLERTRFIKGEPFESRKFNIKSEDDWQGICVAVEKLMPELSTSKSRQDIESAVKKTIDDTKLLDLFGKNPKLLESLPKDADLLTLSEEGKESLRELISVSGDLATAMICELAKEPSNDLEMFVEILKKIRLATINALITTITSKLAFIDKFEIVVLDERSYERRGLDSVHNLIRDNSWIVNRDFVVLHSDETINKILEAKDNATTAGEAGVTRPDFVCLTEMGENEKGRRYVIIEIKKPGIKIDFNHVKQAKGYKLILEKHSGEAVSDYQVYLIGSEIDTILKETSMEDVHVMTYTDLTSKARRFYKEYMENIKKNPLSV